MFGLMIARVAPAAFGYPSPSDPKWCCFSYVGRRRVLRQW